MIEYFIIIPPFPVSLPDIPYYFGREDCPRSPFATEKGVFRFPDTFAAWPETRQWFVNNLWDGITTQEIVTLMGMIHIQSVLL